MDVLAQLFAARGWGQMQGRRRLEEAWREAAGATAARETQVGSLRRGVLEILVRNSILLQELAHYHKQRLLQALQRLLGDARVTDLRFRLGSWE
jgi:hypothetical protein